MCVHVFTENTFYISVIMQFQNQKNAYPRNSVGVRVFVFSGTILTILCLMREVDSVVHHESIVSYLSKLIEVDSMRENYYQDLS